MFFQVFFIPWRCFVMLKENLSFIGVCALVFAALLGLAYLFERTVCHDLQRRSRSRKENQARPEHSFHIRRHCFSLWMKICQKYK